MHLGEYRILLLGDGTMGQTYMLARENRSGSRVLLRARFAILDWILNPLDFLNETLSRSTCVCVLPLKISFVKFKGINTEKNAPRDRIRRIQCILHNAAPMIMRQPNF